jgi:hypothetical protein
MKTFKQQMNEQTGTVVNPFDGPVPSRNPSRGAGSYRYKAQQMMKNRWAAQQAARQVQQSPELKPAEVSKGIATAVKQVRAAQAPAVSPTGTARPVNPSQIATKTVSDIKSARPVPLPDSQNPSVIASKRKAARSGSSNIAVKSGKPPTSAQQVAATELANARKGARSGSSNIAVKSGKPTTTAQQVAATELASKRKEARSGVSARAVNKPPPEVKSVSPSSTVKASLGPSSTIKARDAGSPGPPLPTKAPAVPTKAPSKMARGQVPPPMRNPSPAYRIKRNVELGNGPQTSTPAVAGGAKVPSPVRNPRAPSASSSLVSPANAATASPTSSSPTPRAPAPSSNARATRQRGVQRARPRSSSRRSSRKSSWGFGGSGSRATTSGQMVNRSLGGVFEEQEQVPKVVKESFESFIRNKFLKENHE